MAPIRGLVKYHTRKLLFSLLLPYHVESDVNAWIDAPITPKRNEIWKSFSSWNFAKLFGAGILLLLLPLPLPVVWADAILIRLLPPTVFDSISICVDAVVPLAFVGVVPLVRFDVAMVRFIAALVSVVAALVSDSMLAVRLPEGFMLPEVSGSQIDAAKYEAIDKHAIK